MAYFNAGLEFFCRFHHSSNPWCIAVDKKERESDARRFDIVTRKCARLPYESGGGLKSPPKVWVSLNAAAVGRPRHATRADIYGFHSSHPVKAEQNKRWNKAGSTFSEGVS